MVSFTLFRKPKNPRKPSIVSDDLEPKATADAGSPARSGTPHRGLSTEAEPVRRRFRVRPGFAAELSEKVVKLAQKLGQLQPLIAVFPQECMGQLAYFGPT